MGAYALTSDFSRVLATGINGQVRGIDDDNQSRWTKPAKYKYVQHSEANVVANAARTGTPLDNAVIAVTKFPCSTCTKLLVQAGIKKIYTNLIMKALFGARMQRFRRRFCKKQIFLSSSSLHASYTVLFLHQVIIMTIAIMKQQVATSNIYNNSWKQRVRLA